MVMEYREKLQESCSGAQERSEKGIQSALPNDSMRPQDATAFSGLSNLVYRPKRPCDFSVKSGPSDPV